MIRWSGKVAMVTGASSGIGAAIVRQLAQHGVLTVGVARRQDKVQELAEDVKKTSGGTVYPFRADVTKEDEVKAAFDWVRTTLNQPVHILVNNAGVSILRDTKDGRMEEWRTQFDTNVLAAGICMREQLRLLQEYGEDEGQIINMGSIVSHKVLPSFPGFYVYSASKFALKVISEGVRQELANAKSRIRVTNLCPGYTKTELFETAGEYSKQSEAALASFAHLLPENLAEAVLYILSQPQQVRVHDLTIQATGELF